MAKSSKDPKEIFPEIIDDYRDAFQEDLISIILYGSATGPDYRPGKSDLNLMIVVSEYGITTLERAFELVKKWRKKNVAIPLFLTENYIKTSLDAFPIEYLSLQRNHMLLYGKDVLKDLVFDREYLRLQCEREVKGKLLLLRQAFLETEGKGRVLEGIIRQSLPAFVSIFESLLHVMGAEVPSTKREIIKTACRASGMDADVFQKLLDIKEKQAKESESQMKTLFNNYLREVRNLALKIDELIPA